MSSDYKYQDVNNKLLMIPTLQLQDIIVILLSNESTYRIIFQNEYLIRDVLLIPLKIELVRTWPELFLGAPVSRKIGFN